MKKVLILGAGPAGLMAAHAVAMNGDAHFIVLSKKGRKSKMMGAQYLHRPIPGISAAEDEFQVDYDLRGGTAEDYRYKVYGKNWDGTVSPEDLPHSHPAWNIRTAYDKLWDEYSDAIMDWELMPGHPFFNKSKIEETLAWAGADLVISTVPAPLLCFEGHTFRSTVIWSTDRPIASIQNNQVILNAAEAPAWYRAARIDGWDTVEWPGNTRKPPLHPLWEVEKPLTHNCNCFPEIQRMGRYGAWKKGVLSHEVFYELNKQLAGV